VALTGATAQSLLGATITPVTGTAVTENDTSNPSAAISGATLLSGAATTGSTDLATGITTGDTLVVNGTTFTFTAGTTSGTTIGIGDTLTHLLSAIDTVAGGTSSVSAGGAITIGAGANGLTLSGGALTKLGLSTIAAGDGLAGQTLSIGATGGGTATAITFGLGQGQVSTLNGLNSALAVDNLQATIDSSTGKISITTSNDAASSTIAGLSGSAALTGGAFYNTVTTKAFAAAAPVADPNSQASRAALVGQYNNVLAQINTTAQD